LTGRVAFYTEPRKWESAIRRAGRLGLEGLIGGCDGWVCGRAVVRLADAAAVGQAFHARTAGWQSS